MFWNASGTLEILSTSLSEHYTYLFIDLAVLMIPLAWSFERKISFYKYWPVLFLSIFLTSLLFVSWDIFFTSFSVWGFNDRYLLGIRFFGLPLEEILFFVCIPYACVFTHQALKLLWPINPVEIIVKQLTGVLIMVLAIVLVLNVDKWYTLSATALAIITILVLYRWSSPEALARIYLSYFVLLFPFLIVNGLLTGSFIDEEVVWYNNTQNLMFRIGTIPIEDVIYGFSLLAINMALFDFFKDRKIKYG